MLELHQQMFTGYASRSFGGFMSALRQSFSWALVSSLVLTGSCGDTPDPLEPVVSQALAKKKPPVPTPPPDTVAPPTNDPPPDTEAPAPPAFSEIGRASCRERV